MLYLIQKVTTQPYSNLDLSGTCGAAFDRGWAAKTMASHPMGRYLQIGIYRCVEQRPAKECEGWGKENAKQLATIPGEGGEKLRRLRWFSPPFPGAKAGARKPHIT